MIKHSDIYERGGTGLMAQYNGSHVRALTTIYPEFNWQPWRFTQSPKSNLQSVQSHREFFDHMAKKLNLKHMDDWYNITRDGLLEKRTTVLHEHYGDSLVKALQTAYPEVKWLPWKFTRVPSGYWQHESNVRAYVEWAGAQLGVAKLEDWHGVSVHQVRNLYGNTLLKMYGGLIKLLAAVYPNHPWESTMFKGPSSDSKSQRHLFHAIQTLMPGAEVLYNYTHPNLTYSKSSLNMELDVFVPSHSLGFEFQGSQHYSFHFFFGNATSQQLRDSEKKKCCEKSGITLIEVPSLPCLRLIYSERFRFGGISD
jgi:hypothetical protein